MSANMNTSPSIHIFKQKPRMLAGNFINILILMIALGVLLIFNVPRIMPLFRMENLPDVVANTSAVIAGFLILMMILMAFGIILSIILVFLSFFSFMKITPDGIEQKVPLSMHIRCNWSDLDRIDKLFFSDVIYLNSFEVVGMSISLKAQRFFRAKQGFMVLKGYEGWPNGLLADDLRQYAPKLFENKPLTPQAAYPESKEGQAEAQATEIHSITQTDRTWAALAHGSVLIPNLGFCFPIGIIVPLGIYLTQNKKSSYLGFQTLQALIWQIFIYIINSMVFFCLFVSLTVYNFQANMSNIENPGSIPDGLGIIFFVITFSFGAMYILPAIYGIVGAVKTYQGEDFRYFVIGNLIGKSKVSQRTNRS